LANVTVAAQSTRTRFGMLPCYKKRKCVDVLFERLDAHSKMATDNRKGKPRSSSRSEVASWNKMIATA